MDLSTVTAVILAGGLGTRLRGVVADRPKVLAEVAGRPFLTYLLDQFAAAGVRQAVLCTGYRGEQVQATLGDCYGPLRLSYSLENEPLGTGGALRWALPLLTTAEVLVTNGDSYCDANLREFAAWHRQRRAAGSLALAQVENVGRFGRVETDDQGCVTAFREKMADASSGWINAGIYLLSRPLLESLPAGRAVSLEKETFPAWVGRGLCAWRAAQSRFIDIGIPETYAEAERFFQALPPHPR